MIVTALSAPIILLIRNKPKHFPSVTAYKTGRAPLNFVNNMKTLAKNPMFYLMMVGFAVGYGGYSTLGGVVSPLCSSFGFNMQ